MTVRPRRPTRATFILIAAVFGGALVSGAQTPEVSIMEAEDTASGESSGDSRVWLRLTDSESGPRAAVKVRFQDDQPADQPLIFDCEVHSESDIGSVIVALHVLNDLERPVRFASLDLRADEGRTDCRFIWDRPAVPDGEYSAHFDVIRPGSGFILASATVSLARLSRSTVYEQVADARGGLANLRRHIERFDVALADWPEASARLALAVDALAALPADETDWRRMIHISEFARRQTAFARARLTFTKGGAGSFSLDARPVTMEGGTVEARGGPLFLAGVYGLAPTGANAARLDAYGLNLAGLIGTHDVPNNATAFMDAAEARGVGVVYFHGQPMREFSTPSPVDGEEYSVETAVGTSATGLDQAISTFAPYENLLGISFVTAPRFMFSGEEVAAQFRDWLEVRYEDRYALNRAWRTRFFGFDEVEPWWDLTRTPYQYDWQNFHRSLGTAFFRSLARHAGRSDAKPALFPTVAGDYFEEGETRYGIERDELAQGFPVQAFRYDGTRTDPRFARAYPADLMEIVLRRSLDPADPILEVADYRLHGEDFFDEGLRNFVRSYVWDATVEGLNAIAFRGWDRDASPDGLLNQWNALEGLVRANVELNRHAGVLRAFQTAPAPLAILLSDSAKIYKDGSAHLDSLREAFVGCTFSGIKTRFLTEDQLAAGQLEGIRAIALPNTPALRDEAFNRLEELAQTPMVFIRSGGNITYDAWGRSRTDVIRFKVDSLFAHEDKATDYMHALEAAVVMGKLPERPRAVNAFGYTLEGVRTRSVEYDSATYVYLMNLRDQPVSAFLAGPYQSGIDVLRDRPVRFPITLEPLEPYLIRMDSPRRPDAAIAMEAAEPSDAPDVPSAVVRPVEEPAAGASR